MKDKNIGMNKIVEEDLERIASEISIDKCRGKSFLITGASGFLGKWVVDLLMYLNETKICEEKCRVIALCRNADKARRVLGEYYEKNEFGMIEQGVEKQIDFIGKIDYIIHAASIAVTSGFTKDPVGVLAANVIGTYNLLELARTNCCEGVLFLSSGAVYGKNPDDINEIREEDFFQLDFSQLENCYSEGKRAGELLCRAYWRQYHVPTKIVRISHTYGPGINIEDGRVFSDFVKNILNGEDLLIRGTGLDSRPFCYVSDAVIAFFRILFEGEAGETYNMANAGQTYTISELAEILTEKAFGDKGLKVRYLRDNLDGKSVKKIMVNTEKLNRLGWEPKINAVEGFRRTVASFED